MSDAGQHRMDARLERREERVLGSALWAAAGDALGWITELSRDVGNVAYRSGAEVVIEPIDWHRHIGGRNGPRVFLPAGTYSDDTQLRLCVCRSIQGDGHFDVEAFAKVEVTVWQTYALGAGLGTKAGAANLARRSVNWFSNFYENGTQRYVYGGGNGAAMRIQPHVWASASFDSDSTLLDVIRDALTTHGHPQGFCGAFFHALCVGQTLQDGVVPGPSDWHEMIKRFHDIGRLVQLDPQLSSFWLAAWENEVGKSLSSALGEMIESARHDVKQAALILNKNGSHDSYIDILDALGCRSDEFRGAGFKTALAAAALAWIYRGGTDPKAALVIAANELRSDTDTIATMAGAILGAAQPKNPSWPIQDRDYLEREARRLARIGMGNRQDSFGYPDLGHWNAPTSHTAAMGQSDGSLAIAGLGTLTSLGEEHRAGDAVWQWLALPFGQTILAKRKFAKPRYLPSSQLPNVRLKPPTQQSKNSIDVVTPQASFVPVSTNDHKAFAQAPPRQQEFFPSGDDDLDAWTDVVIRSDFDDRVLGQLFNRCIELNGSIDVAIAFAAIIAKAKLARSRRRRG